MIQKIPSKNPPNFIKVGMLCDEPISNRLKEIDVIKDYFNYSNTTVIVGPPKSGKTSTLMNFFNVYKKCFTKVFVFMKKTSRSSLKNNIFDKHLPKDQIFDVITIENLSSVINKIEINSSLDDFSLIILDDVQNYLKNAGISKMINEIIANHRHLRLTTFILLQNFIKLEAPTRNIIDNLILYEVNKKQKEKIYEDHIDFINDKQFNSLCNEAWKIPHGFLLIPITHHKFFGDFNKLQI